MANARGIGGLFGSLMVLGASMWGVKKIGEALDSDKSKTKSFLKDTEPFN